MMNRTREGYKFYYNIENEAWAWERPDGVRKDHSLLTREEIQVRERGPWASCQIRKIVGAHAPGMPGTFSPPPQVSDAGMRDVRAVMHVGIAN